jgi:hypothetical protein
MADQFRARSEIIKIDPPVVELLRDPSPCGDAQRIGRGEDLAESVVSKTPPRIEMRRAADIRDRRHQIAGGAVVADKSIKCTVTPGAQTVDAAKAMASFAGWTFAAVTTKINRANHDTVYHLSAKSAAKQLMLV